MNNEILKVDNIWKVYKEGDVKAIQSVTLAIHKGDFVAIIGRSGSGKSTLLHMIGLMDTPTKGKIYLMEKEVGDLEEEEKVKIRGKNIGFIFQTFNLMSELNTIENVAIAGMINGMSYFQALDKAKVLLENIGMGGRLNHEVQKLSGGERQRVAIARALINNPTIILGDEPTGNLDTKTRDQIMDYLEKLNEQGMTIIVVTHDLDIAKRAKSIIRLQDGKIIKHYLIQKRSGQYDFFQREKIENAIIKAGGSAEIAENIGTQIELLVESKKETSTDDIRKLVIKELEKAGKREVAKKYSNFKKIKAATRIT